jgi:hypothetical protein
MKSITEWDQFHRVKFAASHQDGEELALLTTEIQTPIPDIRSSPNVKGKGTMTTYWLEGA